MKSQHKWQLSKDIQQGWFYIFVEAFRAAATRPGGHFLIAVSEKIIQLLTISSNFYKLSPTTLVDHPTQLICIWILTYKERKT